LFPRSGHRVAVDEANLYVLGGYNPKFWGVENTDDTYYPLFKELWKFNFATRKWTLLPTDGHMPHELASHSVVRYGRNLLCFGGTGVPFGQSSSNQLHVCNLDTLKWRNIQCEGELPKKKYGHTIITLGTNLYVCGGTSGFVYDLDVHRLDLQSRVWKKLPVLSRYIPDSRYRHEVVCDETRIYVFGGGTAADSFGFEKIPSYDLQGEIWEDLTTKPDPKHGFPAPRKCHSCVKFKNAAYICGGFDTEIIMNDVWKLSLSTFQWTKIPSQLQVPVYFHSADVTKEGCMYIFGGVSKIDMVRTNCLQRVWLTIPSLRELCWEHLCSLHNMEKLSRNKDILMASGIPLHYIERLS
ncbi:hypothetical protein FSP39_016129, partial [Pinctada imbricata]